MSGQCKIQKTSTKSKSKVRARPVPEIKEERMYGACVIKRCLPREEPDVINNSGEGGSWFELKEPDRSTGRTMTGPIPRTLVFGHHHHSHSAARISFAKSKLWLESTASR